MVQLGFKCGVYGDVNHDECRACSIDPVRHKCMYSPVMLEQMREKPDPEREGIFSPTQLTRCFRQDALVPHVDRYDDPDELWRLTRGNMFHSWLEKCPYPGALDVLIERRLIMDIETKYGTKRFGGKPDVVVLTDVESSGSRAVNHVTIVDWKTTAELGHDYKSAYDDHIFQLNAYKWLVESVMGSSLVDVVVDRLELYVMSMSRVRRFTSIQELTTRGKMTKRSHPKEYETITLQSIPILPNEEIERLVVEQVEKRIEAVEQGILPEIIPEDSPDKWRCNFCPVKEKCYQIGERKDVRV